MFPGGEGMPDLNALMQQAQQMQDQMLQAQEELAEARVEGTAGGGLVKATVTGTGDLVSLTISPEACDPEDTETLADLVVAAIRDAATTAQNEAVEKLGPLSGGFGEGLGEGLGGILGGAPGEAPGDEPGNRGQLGF